MNQILFLCTGNYYRSRFAEIYFNWHARHHELMWRAKSRGLALQASNPGPISSHVADRLSALEISCSSSRRLPLAATATDFEGVAQIVAVKRAEHEPLLRVKFPRWLDRIEFWEIDDIDDALPSEALSHLERKVTALVERLVVVDGPAVRVA